MSEETSVRDHLARDRSYLANERTLLAYLRTALAFLGLGVFTLKFISTLFAVLPGLALIGLGICTGFFGVYRFFHYQRLIEKR